MPSLYRFCFAASEIKAAAGPLKTGPQIYQSIGVEPVINCRGTFTIIGASIELPEVRAAMDAAAQHYVQLDELADAVGRRLAELTGAEWGMVSAGCAAGLKHVTAACVAGGNPEKLIRIPDLTGLDKTEVVIPRSSRSVYDHAVRNVGVKVITVDTAEELENALCSRTAMIYLTAGGRLSQDLLPWRRSRRWPSPGTSPSWWMPLPRTSPSRTFTCNEAPRLWPIAAGKRSAAPSAPDYC